MEIVAVKVPGVQHLDPLAGRLRPRVAVRQRGVQCKCADAEDQEDDGPNPAHAGPIPQAEHGRATGDEVVGLAKTQDGKVQSREVVVQEQLALHQEEGEVVACPAEHRGPDLVVEPLEDRAAIVLISPLPTEDGETLEQSVDGHGSGGSPPDDGIPREVDLTVVPAPEVDAATKHRPRRRPRVPRVRRHETGVRAPHDLLQLPELAEEARLPVVDLFGVGAELGMVVAFDVPDAVREGAPPGARHLLLLVRPRRKLHLVGEEDTSGDDVDQLELGLDGPKTFLGFRSVGQRLDNLDSEVVVRVPVEPLEPVGGDLILPLGLGDRCSNVVRMQATVGLKVVEPKDHLVLDEVERRESIPSLWTVDGAIETFGLGLILEQPYVVVVLVRVQGDLLLLASGGVHMVMGMQIAALGVVVSEGDPAAKRHVNGHVLHRFRVERRLEFRGHETVAVTRINQAYKVDGEHAHVKRQRDDDEAERSRKQMLEPKTLYGTRISFKHVMSVNGGPTGVTVLVSPRSTHSCSTVKQPTQKIVNSPTHLTLTVAPSPIPVATSQNHQFGSNAFSGPCSCWFVKQVQAKAVKAVKIMSGESSRMSRDCVRRPFSVEEVSGQSPQWLERSLRTKDDQAGAKGCGSRATSICPQRQEHGWYRQDATDSREHSHRNIWNLGLHIVLPNLLEVEISLEAGKPSGESQEKLRQRRMYVHKETPLDVLGREAAKALRWSATSGIWRELVTGTYCTSSKTTLLGWYIRKSLTTAPMRVRTPRSW